MAIRKVVSRSITDGTIAAADIANTTITAGKLVAGAGGVGFFQGEMVIEVILPLVKVTFFVCMNQHLIPV